MRAKWLLLGFVVAAVLVPPFVARAEGLSSGAEKLLGVEELGGEDVESVRVNIDTDKGSFLVEIYPDIAPLSASNFMRLVLEGYYDGIIVHRVVEDFVMQAGQPTEQQQDKQELDTRIADEVNRAHHDPRTISFAKLYDTETETYVPDSAGAQFFISLGDNRRLDENFTVFGKVVWGMETVRKIKVGDTIIRAYVVNVL
jgi:cyclophilin family peptidyl-prolyl cis-trans isomerase